LDVELHAQVVQAKMHWPQIIGPLMQVTYQQARLAEGVAVAGKARKVTAPTPAHPHGGLGFGGSIGRDVVDDAADSLGTILNLAAAFEYFHSRHAVDDGSVIKLGLAIRAQRYGHAIFEHQHGARTVGVHAADADVGA
jgi:hypothetical protein